MIAGENLFSPAIFMLLASGDCLNLCYIYTVTNSDRQGDSVMEKERKNQANILARECIVSALLQLIKKEPLSAVTISELTERAGVSRMTFYRNYESKEDIFRSYMSEILDKYELETEKKYGKKKYYDQENLLHCFKYFREYSDFLDGLILCGYGHFFLRSISDYMVRKWTRSGENSMEVYKMRAFAGALYGLYIAWSENHYRETPEEMVLVLKGIYDDI
jgi:AcrR family transcriptional regulator